ncbi:3-deoxy-manno-octulosonate cytidylyltransferase [Novosphingobium sp. FSY-8]|uniref:3-deoxy-manno-octulosonate cytidylyltransferase n=1 Tax=Novosphingobium ovatum TaxID=1908523 RepID=A0ABW9XEG6_9SPHN|nr:3-deoxy-manno-octulosonate cytidylyltransferase [Novosphingobium ovatum]NBC36907.1 3-deoxy-manno-octulosonate cytidylyltransferase [Novosphingobium ovatum]
MENGRHGGPMMWHQPWEDGGDAMVPAARVLVRGAPREGGTAEVAVSASALRVAVIVPARFGSSRCVGKPLAMLRGAGGVARPLIEWSWQAARAAAEALERQGVPLPTGGTETAGALLRADLDGDARGLSQPDAALPVRAEVWVATDDARIADCVRRFGGQVVMTAPDCRNGTERCADAVARLGLMADVVVNVQGDAPLMPPDAVARAVAALVGHSGAAMATAALRGGAEGAATEGGGAEGAGVTMVVANAAGRALYFSRAQVPFGAGAGGGLVHLGVYAYAPWALADYVRRPPSALEQAEGLEQLRFLEGAAPVMVALCDAPGWPVVELNHPQDAARIESILVQRGVD